MANLLKTDISEYHRRNADIFASYIPLRTESEYKDSKMNHYMVWQPLDKQFLHNLRLIGFSHKAKVTNWKKIWHHRSKYTPHQGKQECQRRLHGSL